MGGVRMRRVFVSVVAAAAALFVGAGGMGGAVVAPAAASGLTEPAAQSRVVAQPADPSVSGATAAAQTFASGADWTIERTDAGFLVTVTTAAPLPVRDAVPLLWADGVALGVAEVSSDRMTLTVTTADPAVQSAASVLVGWSGEGDPADDGSGSGLDDGPSAVAAEVDEAADPATTGPFGVVRADYDLGDQAEEIYGFRGLRGELRAAVYLPEGAPGERPVAVFLHGQHVACWVDATTQTADWPCAAGEQEVPSYLGYDRPAEALASNGYAVVSISANAINQLNGANSGDLGTDARGHLVLDHLALLRQANAGPVDGLPASLQGRLDLDDVGLMGHSRGGDGIVRAATLNAALAEPFGIRGLLPLAPTDFFRTPAPDVPLAVLLPYCDGDLSDLQGQHYFNDSRYGFGDDVLRASVLVMGANHNYFNTVWTPGGYPVGGEDDWLHDGSADDPTCGAESGARLATTEQNAVGAAYVAGFFRLTLGEEAQFLALFDGSDARPASAGRADVRVTASYPASARADVNTFADATVPVSTTGRATAEYCASAASVAQASALPFCLSEAVTEPQGGDFAGGLYGARIPATTSMHVTFGEGEGALVVPVTTPIGPARFLTFRALPDESVTTSIALSVTLTDASGAAAEVQAADYGQALTRLPGSGALLPKALFQDIRIPVEAFDGIDLSTLTAVRIGSPGSDSGSGGGVLLSDLAFVGDAAVGTAQIIDRPTVSPGRVTADAAGADATVDVPLILSRESEGPASLWLTSYVTSLESQEVAVPTGSRCVNVTVPLTGSRAPVPGGEAVFGTALGYPTGYAVLGEITSSVHIGDPDAVLPAGDLPYGRQGDACAEALTAASAPEPLAAPASAGAGSTVTVTASGYRQGEGVRLVARAADVSDPAAAPLVSASAVSVDGTVAFTLTVPDLVGSELRIRTLGVGSARVSEAVVAVTPAPAPTPAPHPEPSPGSDVAGEGSARLAATGASTGPFALAPLGAAALLLGAAVLMLWRRPARGAASGEEVGA